MIMCLMGLTLMAAGIYLFVVIREAMTFNVGATVLGVVIALVSLVSCCLRTSKVRLFLFNFLSNFFCALDIALTVGYWIKRSYIIDKVVEYSNNEDDA